MTTRKKQRGLTLPELMVAILLSTIISAAVLGVYLSTSRNFQQDERYALMQENGRYAIRTLAEDLAMADFWGKMTAIDSATTTLAPTGNCASGTPAANDGIGLFDGTTALLYNNMHTGGTAQFAATWPCTEVTNDQRANTGILAVKRVLGSPQAVVVNGLVRLRTNGVTGAFVNDNSGPDLAAGENDWRYVPRIYFIRDYFQTAGDGIPSLCRMDLVGTSMGDLTSPGPPAPPQGTADTPTCIAEGIEDFHVQFGIDTDSDGIANQYLSSPTLAQIEGVVSARIFVLARTSDDDPHYTDSKSFTLGDVNLAQADLTGTNYYRRVFTTTVMLRNPLNMNMLNN